MYLMYMSMFKGGLGLQCNLAVQCNQQLNNNSP